MDYLCYKFAQNEKSCYKFAQALLQICAKWEKMNGVKKKGRRKPAQRGSERYFFAKSRNSLGDMSYFALKQR